MDGLAQGVRRNGAETLGRGQRTLPGVVHHIVSRPDERLTLAKGALRAIATPLLGGSRLLLVRGPSRCGVDLIRPRQHELYLIPSRRDARNWSACQRRGCVCRSPEWDGHHQPARARLPHLASGCRRLTQHALQYSSNAIWRQYMCFRCGPAVSGCMLAAHARLSLIGCRSGFDARSGPVRPGCELG